MVRSTFVTIVLIDMLMRVVVTMCVSWKTVCTQAHRELGPIVKFKTELVNLLVFTKSNSTLRREIEFSFTCLWLLRELLLC